MPTTVKELIKELQKYPEDMEIRCSMDDIDDPGKVEVSKTDLSDPEYKHSKYEVVVVDFVYL